MAQDPPPSGFDASASVVMAQKDRKGNEVVHGGNPTPLAKSLLASTMAPIKLPGPPCGRTETFGPVKIFIGSATKEHAANVHGQLRLLCIQLWGEFHYVTESRVSRGSVSVRPRGYAADQVFIGRTRVLHSKE